MQSSLLTANVNGFELTARSYYTPANVSARADAAHNPKDTDEIGKPETPVLFCLPGGGIHAGYFDLAPGFSFAEKMTRAGYRVIAMDHPGTATNPLPGNSGFLDPHAAATLIANAARAWLKEAPAIGVGHSMGGMTITLIEAHHRLFDGLALFGSNAGGLDWGLTAEEKTYIDQPEAVRRDLERLTLAKFKTPFPRIETGPGDRSITFGGETPELTSALRDVSCALFAAGGLTSMIRGSFRTEVEALEIPLFFAVGAHDIGIPAEDIPKDYINAPAMIMHICEDAGHNSFAFRSIDTLCSRLDHWIRSLSNDPKK